MTWRNGCGGCCRAASFTSLANPARSTVSRMAIDPIKTSADTAVAISRGFNQCGIDLAPASCDVGRRSGQGMDERADRR